MSSRKITKGQARRDALKFLKDNITAVVATSFNDKPYASTVYYIIDSKFNFYFFTKRRTNKYLNLAINTAAALVVGSGPEAVCVQVNGVAHIVYKSEKEKILKKILSEVAKKRSRLVPIEELEPFNRKEDIVANSRVVFKVAPKEIFFFNLNCKRYPESQSRDYIKIIP